jgi:hypothetical protein
MLSRTHYQVDEPAFMELLIKYCTSPVQSAYDETIAQRLTREVRSRHKDFNPAAAAYALDLAQGLGLVNKQNVWTDMGHLVNLVAQIHGGAWEEDLELGPSEQLLHFRLFLEADGAALLFIGRYLVEHGMMPNTDSDWNDLAKQLFLDIYSSYLRIAGTTADRVALRTEIDRVRSRGYTGKSGPHKMFVHLQTLYRLGLIHRVSSAARRYELRPEDDGRGLPALVAELPDAYALEAVIKGHRWADVAARVFMMGDVAEQAAWHHEDLLRLLVPHYQLVMSTGVPLCALTTVIEAVQIELLARRSKLLPYATALELLQRAQREHMRDLRFHVDRRGTPAFLKLSKELVAFYATPSGSGDAMRDA